MELTFIRTLIALTSLSLAANSLAQNNAVSVDLISPRVQEIDFNLPEQTLSSSLMEFAVQANMTVIVDYKLIKNYAASPINGKLSIEECLQQLLDKTNLDFEFKGRLNALVIVEKPQTPEAEFVEASTNKHSVEEIQVLGLSLPYRYNTISNSHLHGSLTDFDYPRFFNSLPQKLISDQQPLDLGELLRNSSSVVPGDGLADSNDDFYLRGFPRHALFFDGMRLDKKIGTKIAPALIQHVEIIKGPSTLHYGQGEPGGVVNVLSRRGGIHSGNRVQTSAGTEGQKSFSFELNQALQKNRFKPRLSLTGGIDQYDTLNAVTDIKRRFIRPSLDIQLSENVHTNLSYLKQISEQTHTQGSILLTPDGESLTLVSVPGKLKTAQDGFEADFDFFSTGIEIKLPGSWRLRGQYGFFDESRSGVRGSESIITDSPTLVSASDLDPSINYVTMFDGIIPLPIGTVINQPQSQIYDVATINSLWDESGVSNSNFSSLKLEGTIELFSVDNHLSLGLERYWQKNEDIVSFIQRDDIKLITLNSEGLTDTFDLVDVIYAEQNFNQQITSRYQYLNYTDYGAYIENAIEFNPSWLLSIGTRWTQTKGELDQDQTLNEFKDYSSQAGLVFRPTDDLSIYLSYSEGMQPNYIVDDLSVSADLPEQSFQNELGIKWMGFSGRLMATAALYEITKENVAYVDYKSAARSVNFNTEQVSRGADLDFTWQASKAFNLIGNVAYNQSEITAGSLAGYEPQLIPSLSSSLFANLELPLGKKNSINFNLGARYIGDRFSNPENTEVLESFKLMDMGLSLQSELGLYTFDLGFAIKNLFDEVYTASSAGALRADQGYGRRYSLSLGLRFP